MPDLEPITREEMLLDGQDLEPITRKEMFIKRIYDKTQVVPEPITREEMFLKKAGDETTDVTIEQLNVSANGTYSESGKAYSPVIVNVPAPPIPDNAYLLNEVEGLPSDIATFSDGSNLPMPKLQVGIEPVQEGSGDPSPTNVRPISGHTGANIGNITNVELQPFFNGLFIGTYAFVDLGTLTWTKRTTSFTTISLMSLIKRPVSIASTINIRISDLQYNNKSSNADSGVAGSYDFIVSQNGQISYRYPMDGFADGDAFKSFVSGHYLLYELATPTTPTITPTQFSTLLTAFGVNGYMIPVSWQTEAGTVYGGKLNVTSGELTVDRANVDLGTLDYGFSSSISVFYSTITNMKAPSTSADRKNGIISSMFPVSNSISISESMDDKSMLRDAGTIVIRDTDYNDTSAFKTAMSGVQLVYELATPITIQLTPTQVKSLLGSNNVWADTGKIEELEYFSKEV